MLRWSGRVLGGVAALWWVAAVVLGALGDDPYAESSGATAESVGVVVLAVANAAAYLLSWFRQRSGARALVVTGALFCVFALLTAGRAHLLAMSVSGLPFVVSGALLWAADRESEGRQPPTPKRRE